MKREVIDIRVNRQRNEGSLQKVEIIGEGTLLLIDLKDEFGSSTTALTEREERKSERRKDF